jgi:hypothetical protein
MEIICSKHSNSSQSVSILFQSLLVTHTFLFFQSALNKSLNKGSNYDENEDGNVVRDVHALVKKPNV